MDSQLPKNGTMNALFNEKTIKKIIAATLVGVILAAGISTTAFSFSWFSNRNNVTKNIEGKTAGAYFARGRGTQDDPFVINRPIHLYNLAWLQDVGYFDSKRTYFIIEKDLDMAGWTLPPIGNEVHPFIGELDGFDTVHGTNKSAVKISNLTISNKFSDFQRHPSSITSISGCNAMGFFGTFGEEKKDYAEDAPVAKNFYLDNVTVKSKEQKNLIGSLAGYVNGKISDIGISNSTISLPANNHSFKNYTSNLSDYTSIGYCEDKYKNTAYEKEVALQSSDLDTSQGTEGDGGAEAGNGGSIDMNTMYNNLLSIWNGNEMSRTQAPTKRIVTYNLDGTINEAETMVTERKEDGNRTDTQGNTYYYTYYHQKNAGEISSSYTFAYDPSDNGRNFMTLYGRKEITSTLTCEVTTVTPKTLPYRFIADSTGNNYLSMNENGNIVNQTSKALASSWFINDKNQIFTRDDNNIQHFLRNASGTLEITISSGEATSWTYDQNNNQISNEGLFINYSGNRGWNLSVSAYYKITDMDSTYWICNNGTTLTMPNSSNSESNATLWYLDGENYATNVNGTKYYLGISSNNSNVILTTNQSDAFKFNNGYFSIERIKKYLFWETTVTYYMTTETSNYSGNSLAVSEDQNWRYQIKIYQTAEVSLSISEDDSKSEIFNETTKTTETPTYWTKPTYYPISATNGIPDEKNTGYVVSGAYSATDYDPWGDIRVSIFSKSSREGLSNSGVHDSNNTLQTVYTIDDKGQHTVSSNDFDHYTDSKSKFETVLAKDNDYISGLHFMDANISKDHLIEAEYVRIKNQEYHKEDGYELPEDSIDFQLQRKGYVNFFAGTYYTQNTAFFSLHEIERNGSKISNIREISEIYENPTAKQAQSYVYKYNDGTYSVPFLHGSRQGIKYDLNGNPLTNTTPTKTKPEGYSKTVFKTSWIGKTNSRLENYCAYYFEIPTNEGEYALGSVSGAAGAYLCYLDIGANAQRTDITEFHEIKTISVYAYTYPKGVSFSFIEGVDAALPIVDERKSASFSLKESFSGNISVSKSNDSTVQYETTGNSQNVVTEYMFHGYTVKGNGVDITKATGLLSNKIVEDTITKITYSLFNEASSTTIYKKTTVTENGSTTTTNSTLIDGKESSVDWPVDLPWDTLPVKDMATMYVYYVNEKAVNLVIETTFKENYSETEGTHYYKLTGYKVSITNDVDVEVVMTQLKDNTLTVKLKTGTGETEDDYTTLEVNVVTTLTKNS